MTSINVLSSFRHRMTHLSSRNVTRQTASHASPISRMNAPVLKSVVRGVVSQPCCPRH
mgnify:CR=1 FL=1